MYHQIKKVLYHGTVSEIVKLDVTKGRYKKDFGKGFYIAVSKIQAAGMMHKKRLEAVRRSRNKNSGNIKEYLQNMQKALILRCLSRRMKNGWILY